MPSCSTPSAGENADELIGSEGLIGLFSDRAIALAIARKWLRMQRTDGRAVRTVVLHVLDDDRRLVREQVISLLVSDRNSLLAGFHLRLDVTDLSHVGRAHRLGTSAQTRADRRK